jgi:hypothetical protein
MIQTHEAMFGEAGRTCAELVCRHVKLFDEPLESLNIRIVLVPVEIGPYNRHYGYIHSSSFHFIVGNRHICDFGENGVVLHNGGWLVGAEDFIVHELTHYRQHMLLARTGARQSRGVHRDSGWYGAIKEAAPRYLGVQFPESIWPKLKSVRKGGKITKVAEPGRLTEVEVTHLPHSFRALITAGDKRLRAQVVDINL